MEHLLQKLSVENRTLFDAKCLSYLDYAKKLGSERASRLAEDLINAIDEDNAKKLFSFKTFNDGSNEVPV